MGALDNIHTGKSTFMVELMVHTCYMYILYYIGLACTVNVHCKIVLWLTIVVKFNLAEKHCTLTFWIIPTRSFQCEDMSYKIL